MAALLRGIEGCSSKLISTLRVELAKLDSGQPITVRAVDPSTLVAAYKIELPKACLASNTVQNALSQCVCEAQLFYNVMMLLEASGRLAEEIKTDQKHYTLVAQKIRTQTMFLITKAHATLCENLPKWVYIPKFRTTLCDTDLFLETQQNWNSIYLGCVQLGVLSSEEDGYSLHGILTTALIIAQSVASFSIAATSAVTFVQCIKHLDGVAP